MTNRALSRGACGALVDTDISNDLPHIRVENLQEAAEKLAQARRRAFAGQLIGITGSAGKSTTKTMLAHVLDDPSTSVYATTNNQNLLPYITASLCSLPERLDYAILEMAMYSPEMVGLSARLAKPHIGIITSIGMNHAEYHEDPAEGILNSKTELFWGLEPNSTVILPTQDPSYDRLRRRAIESGRVSHIIDCGRSPSDDVVLLHKEELATHSRVTIAAGGRTVAYVVPVPGTHMVNNSLLVAGTLLSLGKPLTLMERLISYAPPRSSIRRFRVAFPDGRLIELIDDAIISSPHQVEALLENIRLRDRARRRVFVFGDMTALGDDDVKLHKEQAAKIEAAGIDKLIAVGALSAHLADDVSIPSIRFKNAFEAAGRVSDEFQDGDLVILKASGPTNFKLILKELYKRAKFRKATMEWTIESETEQMA